MQKAMQVSLTVVRYPVLFVPFAFLSMAIFRIPLALNRSITFYKLMGCGKNGTFDIRPDLRQWAVLACFKDSGSRYPSFIETWWRIFRCEVFTIFLKPLEGHGSWDGKEVFGDIKQRQDFNDPVATLTRATIRLSKAQHFWQNVAPVANKMNEAPGYIFSVGIGEVPWLKQATFSVWNSKKQMMDFAYGTQVHRDVIRKTRDEDWYSEEMFVRFAITGSSGLYKGSNPLSKISNQNEKY